jgi:periplasmic protein TonB
MTRIGADDRVRLGKSIIASACTHVVGFLLALFIIGNMPVTRPPSTDPVDDKASEIVWVNVPGPGRRGGSAGDGKPPSPRKAEGPRRATMTLPVATPPKLAHQPLKDVPEPDAAINIPLVNASEGVVEVPGALTGLPTVLSLVGDGGGGAGIGSGPRGSGIGNGYDGGVGDGAYGPGSGVTMPSVLREVKPSYTAEAMRAKVQGAVMVEAIVREDGSVGQVRIVRSLDRMLGLDEEALKAVKNWRFSPGRRQGRNVAVIVEIELTFTLR